jgi:hypothetical protein
MAQRVDIPNVGLVEFPDGMSDDDIATAIKTKIIPQYQQTAEASKPKPEPLPAKITDFSLKDWANLLGQSYQGAVDTINQSKGRKPVVVPALMGGTGELVKSVGAIGEMFTPNAAPITRAGQSVVESSKEINPVAGTVGEYGSYVAPFSTALKGVRATKLINPSTSLGRAGEAAVAGGLVGYTTTPGTVEQRAESAAINAALGGGAELALPWLGGVAKGAYNQFKGVEPQRLYNPTAAAPLGAQRMPPEIAARFPKQESVPMPGTAGEQTGARLYDYATSLRPYLDLVGGNLGTYGSLIGEVLGGKGLGRQLGLPLRDIPGFRSENLPSIGYNAIKEGLQSNRLQGMMANPPQGLAGSLIAPSAKPTPAPVAPRVEPTLGNPQPPAGPPGPVVPPAAPNINTPAYQRANKSIPGVNAPVAPTPTPVSPAAQAAETYGITPPSNAVQSGFSQELATLAKNEPVSAPVAPEALGFEYAPKQAIDWKGNWAAPVTTAEPAPSQGMMRLRQALQTMPEDLAPGAIDTTTPVLTKAQQIAEQIRQRAKAATPVETALPVQPVGAVKSPLTNINPELEGGVDLSKASTIRSKLENQTLGQQLATEAELAKQGNRSNAQMARGSLVEDIKGATNVTKSGGKLTYNKDMFDDLAKERGLTIDWSQAPDIKNMGLGEGRREMKKFVYGQLSPTRRSSSKVSDDVLNTLFEEVPVSTPVNTPTIKKLK